MKRDESRLNNFNLLRMLAATAVLVSHAWPLSLGTKTTEPLELETGYKLGTTAVTLFFATSGYFIVKSFLKRDTLADFVIARFFRIVPALLFMLILSVMVLGPLATRLPISTFLWEWHTWTYLPHNLLLRNPQWELPGVFTANPGGAAINGSLWTLYYEVLCYGMVVLFGYAALLRPQTYWMVVGATIIAAVLVPQSEKGGTLALTSILFLPFALGGAAYVYRAFLPLSGWLTFLLVGAAVLGLRTPAYPVLHALALSYLAIWFGFSLPWLRGYSRLGDYSYGMYIYAYPIEQIVAWLVPGSTPWTVISLALPLTLMLAIASWTLIERPALDRRHFLRQWYGNRALFVAAYAAYRALPRRLGWRSD